MHYGVMKEVQGLAGQMLLLLFTSTVEQSDASLAIIKLAAFQNTLKCYKNTGTLLPFLCIPNTSIIQQ